MEKNYKLQINEILNILSDELDITETEHKNISKSYEAVGEWLSKPTSPLYGFNPEILPQGSFSLGTVVRPINEEDDIDIDLVCNLEGKPDTWAQINLKNSVGDRLKDHTSYNNMIKDRDGGRRCWTLEYADTANYHMDILPSVASANMNDYLKESFYNDDTSIDAEKLSIRITDKEDKDVDFETETNIEFWKKSNPFGYAKWFYKRAIFDTTKLFSLNEAVTPVDGYSKEKFPLQRAVQILKRHRDIMFCDEALDSDNRPISIIITTLAAKAYDKSDNIIDALSSIIPNLRKYIEPRLNPKNGKLESWVANPINGEENFADKWSETKQKEVYFMDWLAKLESDFDELRLSNGIGLSNLNESFGSKFGKNVSDRTFSNYGNKKRLLREDGKRKMANTTGTLGLVGTTVIKDHKFYGNNE